MPLSWEICLIGNYSREQLDDDFLFHDDLAVTTKTQRGIFGFYFIILVIFIENKQTFDLAKPMAQEFIWEG